MSVSPFCRVAVFSACASLALGSLPAQAGVYQALCTGGAACSVTLANGQISLPGQVIAKDQVLSWSQGGSGSKTDVGMGVATTLMFGLPGLIGFGAKKHDYQFTITYVTEGGDTQSAVVAFKNDVPANQFMLELTGMTGLGVGQVNQALQGRLNQIKAEAAERARIAALDCAPVLKPYSCSWSGYVAANSAARIWAEKYPQLVPAEKARLRAAD